MTTRRYLVTIHESGNMTDEAWKVHTILTSRDFIAPRERVEVHPYDESDGHDAMQHDDCAQCGTSWS
jgi:hypothetical protein